MIPIQSQAVYGQYSTWQGGICGLAKCTSVLYLCQTHQGRSSTQAEHAFERTDLCVLSAEQLLQKLHSAGAPQSLLLPCSSPEVRPRLRRCPPAPLTTLGAASPGSQSGL